MAYYGTKILELTSAICPSNSRLDLSYRQPQVWQDTWHRNSTDEVIE
jgi:hypothetical protein